MRWLIKSPLTIIAVLLGFTLSSFWALVVWKSAEEKAAALTQAGQQTQALTHSLAQHASKSFGAVALALFGASQYIEHSDKSARASAEINDLLAQYAKNIPQVREIGVLSENGDWMYSSFETVPAVNNADREYFRFHQTHPEEAGPRISEPVISRVTGRPTLLMTQRLPNADGSFGGVVFAAIDLAYFRSFYQGFEADQGRTVTLMMKNGKVLVHRQDDQVGKNMGGSSLFVSRLKEASTGLYSIISPFDGRLKQFTFEIVAEFPVVISVAVAEDSILAEWRASRNFDFLLGAVISAILVGLAALLMHQFRERSTMARLLRERERGYRLLAENVEDVVARLDLSGKRLYMSPSIEKMLGWTPAEALQQEGYEILHPAHRELVKHTVDRLGPMERTAMCEYLMRSKSGDYVWVESQFSFIEGTDSSSPEVLVVVRDIAKRKVAEEQLVAANARLKDLSETDTLTGIANRRRFDEMLEREFKRCHRAQSELSLLFIDIDKFKAFNDTYGHTAGDECIQRVANALKSNLKRPGDLVARYGGEEFAVLLPETGAQNAENVAQALRLAVSDMAIPHQGNGHGRVTISIGVAGSRCGTASSPATALAAADTALYVAKENGRNQVSLAAESPSLKLVRPA
ncbi:hypothetical protein UB31_05740 [Bradyrhizobium sp. LTSP849]|uniref:diguanylate cyclase n=1 Tax=Bradyrhizobium sp. LTSP849 TaxID=1615890 RepID=UPI0005D1D687|nr:diguanylate cyclase [Bradyrhizobium sp. LTSP849]KJC54401.1 hypothetical protein UB31_05740 [Bradyrhizobium sp. LTSP849]